MGAGPAQGTTITPPPPLPDATANMLSARRSALRSLAAKRGLGSTFITGAAPAGQSSLLGGGT